MVHSFILLPDDIVLELSSPDIIVDTMDQLTYALSYLPDVITNGQ